MPGADALKELAIIGADIQEVVGTGIALRCSGVHAATCSVCFLTLDFPAVPPLFRNPRVLFGWPLWAARKHRRIPWAVE